MGFYFSFFCTKGSGRYGSDKGSVTHGQTDGNTWREEQYMSPAGETYNSYMNLQLDPF